MDEHNCIKEKEWGILETDIKNICRTLDEIKSNFGTHIKQGEEPGGYRDRLRELEIKCKGCEVTFHNNYVSLKTEISVIKRGYWVVGIVSGSIGGLIGNNAPDFFNFLAKILFK